MVQAFVTTVPKVVPELPAEPSVSRAVVRVKEQSVSALESAPFGANMGGTAETLRPIWGQRVLFLSPVKILADYYVKTFTNVKYMELIR